MIDQLPCTRATASLQATTPSRVILPIVSIIIPALNEQRHIESCLASLVALSTPRGSFEVILVDNGSTDRTVELAETFRSLLDLTILQQAGVRISALRNHGAVHSSGDILAFLDADCLARPHWLSDHEGLADRLADVGVLGAPYDIPPGSTWVARAWEQGQSKAEIGEVRYVPGGCMFMRREVFGALAGFDESLETNEDAELCGRVRTLGLPVIADKSVAVLHLGTSQTLKDFYRRQRWHGAHVLKVFLRSPGRSGNEKAIFLAVYTLMAEFAVLAGLAAAVATGRWSLFAVSVAAWLAPALGLALRRGLSSRHRELIPAFIALYMTYGIARAHCLVAAGKRKR